MQRARFRRNYVRLVTISAGARSVGQSQEGHVLKLLSGAVAALTLGLTAPALAAGPYEPNDSIVTATPLAGAQDYNAAIETPKDQDLFALYIVGSDEVDITVTNVEP